MAWIRLPPSCFLIHSGAWRGPRQILGIFTDSFCSPKRWDWLWDKEMGGDTWRAPRPSRKTECHPEWSLTPPHMLDPCLAIWYVSVLICPVTLKVTKGSQVPSASLWDDGTWSRIPPLSLTLVSSATKPRESNLQNPNTSHAQEAKGFI